ncbi:MAG: hypothetical protein ACREI7_14795, partial [Myxococcota bacterium]
GRGVPAPVWPYDDAVERLVPAVFLVAIAIWEIVATVRAPDGVPGDGEWRQAAAYLRERRAAGELIVFAPRWVDPVGRSHLGDLISLEDAGRMDAARYGVVWELSIRGARAPEARGRQVEETASFGGVSVRKLRGTPVVVVSDLRDSARRVELVEVGFEPHRCALVIPPPGKSVTNDHGRVQLGRTLVGQVGLADVFTRRDIRAPGELEVRIDGASVAAVRVGVEDGWVRFAAATEPGEHHVEVIATASARDRRICYAIEARR